MSDWARLPEWRKLEAGARRKLDEHLAPFADWPRDAPPHATALRNIRSAAKRLREAANALERVPEFTRMHCSLNCQVTPGALDAMADGLEQDAMTAPDLGPKAHDRLLVEYVAEITKSVTGKHHDDMVAAVVGAIMKRPITSDAVKKIRQRAAKKRRIT
jgi:hypothetical protein